MKELGDVVARRLVYYHLMDSDENEGSSRWADLTHECLINILSRLSLEDRWRVAMRVCKSWLEACKDPYLNAVLDLDPYFDAVTDSPRFWTLEFERIVDNMLGNVAVWSKGSLTCVRVRHCSNKSLSLVAQRCHNLEVLSIKSCPRVTDKVMAEVALGCPKIRELDISYCYEISHKSLSVIGSRCPNLHTLRRNFMNALESGRHIHSVPRAYLNACPQDGDIEAAAISECMPCLLHLELRSSKLTAKGIALISQGCQDLEYVDLCGCLNLKGRDITNACSGLKNLKEVKKPDFYIPRSAFQSERYSHWRLYDERFQTDIFRP